MIKPTTTISFLLVFMVALLNLMACEQLFVSPDDKDEFGSLSGLVLDQDTESPITDAIVTALKNTVTDTTDSLGAFLLDSLALGLDTIMVTAELYDTAYSAISIYEDSQQDTVYLPVEEPIDELPVGQLAYVAVNSLGEYQLLYVLDLVTMETRQVTDSVSSSQPRWSPDGEWIAYTGIDIRTGDQVYIIRPDGSDKRIVTLWEINGKIEPHPSEGMEPVWSPDGDRIAFVRYEGCYDIYIVDLDTTDGIHEIKLTYNGYSDGILDWSPDGNKILFHSDEALDGTYDAYGDVYTMNTDGTGKTLVLVQDGVTFGFMYNARYSPDGKKIALTGGMNNTEIYIMDSDGDNLQQITNNYISEGSLSWSPGGDWLAFIGAESGKGPGHIYIMKRDGSDMRQITSGAPEYTAVDWRPVIEQQEVR